MRIGSALAAAAVVVALPRHLVAQLHQAGYPAPTGPVWPVVVVGSAVAWAGLEALTLAHLQRAYLQTRNRGLMALTIIILLSISTVNAPSLVADSAGLSLTGLLGVASIPHWIWAGASTLSMLLVVMAGFVADAAMTAVNPLTDGPVEALIDAIDARRPRPAAVAAQQVTVNVGVDAPSVAKTGGTQSDAGRAAMPEPTGTELRVLEALRSGVKTSKQIAARIGVSDSAVRMTGAWERRKEVMG